MYITLDDQGNFLNYSVFNGRIKYPIKIFIVDAYDQIVANPYDLNEVEVSLFELDKKNLSGKLSSPLNISENSYIFDNLILYADRLTNLNLKFSVNSIRNLEEDYFKFIVNKSQYDYFSDEKYSLLLPIVIETCKIGETFNLELKKCVLCPFGKRIKIIKINFLVIRRLPLLLFLTIKNMIHSFMDFKIIEYMIFYY
jgi:hypothetical protein